MTDPVKITRLPSGLLVATEYMDRVETISMGAYVAAGTRHETEVENGASHFLEHMAFKGTQTRSAINIAEEVENVGGHINAYTARELTAYYIKLLKEDHELGVDILGDILTHSIFDPQEMERERGVILQEIGQANDSPDDIVFDHFQATAYPNQPMGRPTLGSEAHIRNMTREMLQNYMHNNYAANNTIFAAAGNLQHDQIVALVEKYFKDLPTNGRTSTVPAHYQGGEFREERELDQANIVLGFPSVHHEHPDYYAVILLSTILGGGMSSRLFQEIREKRGLVYSVYAYNITHQDDGLFGIYVGTGEEQTKELFPVLIEEIKKIQQQVMPDELKRTRAQLKSSLLMSLESTANRCEQIARQLQIYKRILPTQEVIEKINAITTEDICRVARQIFHGKPTLASLGPIRNVPSINNLTESLIA